MILWMFLFIPYLIIYISVSYLAKVYVSDPNDVLNLDVRYNADYSRIEATRLVLQTYELKDSNDDKDMMQGLRKVAAESSFNVTVFNPYFVFFDQVSNYIVTT